MGKDSNFDVIIAGGGPAGSSAAIHLASQGARVLLAEQKKFPRPKLCGEFISPECLPHFQRLGVFDQMMAARGSDLAKTVFYARSGSSVSIPSTWFGSTGNALGLSRAEMDERLLRRASEAGVTVMEDTQAVGLEFDEGRVAGARFKANGDEFIYRAPITIDATGRARLLARRLQSESESLASTKVKGRPPVVAFKAHLEDARLEPGACEIYFYRGGYGGLNSVEGGFSNLCFIASARDVRACGADPEAVLRKVVCENVRAAKTLATARARSEWLAVSLDGFGRRRLVPVDGLMTIGDAASFIDPFTGSGMLMALENGELAAVVVGRFLSSSQTDEQFANVAEVYRNLYRERFNARLRVCSWLRRAAFVPGLADAAIRIAGANERLRRRLAMATRGRGGRELFSNSPSS
jgi:flavin-dependent dehydrogenase